MAGKLSGVKSADARRRLFVAEYLTDRNATAAAIRAGYAKAGAHVTGSRLLMDPNVQALIADLTEKRHQKLEITVDRVAQELAAIGFSNLLDVMCVTGKDAGRIDLSQVTREQGAAISELHFHQPVKAKGKRGQAGEAEPMRVAKIKLAPKREALVDLGRYLGMFKDDAGPQLTVRFVIDGLEEKG